MQNLITIDTDTPTVMPRLLGAAGNALPPNISAVAGWKQGLRVNFIGGNQPPVGATAKLVMKPRGGSVEVVRTADAVIAANDDGESVGADIKLSVNVAVLQTYLSSREALGCQAAIIVDWTDADGETCHAEWQFIVTIYPSVAGEWSQPATAEELRALAEMLSALAQEIVNKANKTDAALGRNATAAREDATAVGRSATASENSATALGSYAKASGSSATALGRGATASGDSATALGYFAYAVSGSLAIGESARANIEADGIDAGGSVAIGRYCSANGSQTVLLCSGYTSASIPHSTTISADNAYGGTNFQMTLCADEGGYIIFKIEDTLTAEVVGVKISASSFFALLKNNGGVDYTESSESGASS